MKMILSHSNVGRLDLAHKSEMLVFWRKNVVLSPWRSIHSVKCAINCNKPNCLLSVSVGTALRQICVLSWHAKIYKKTPCKRAKFVRKLHRRRGLFWGDSGIFLLTGRKFPYFRNFFTFQQRTMSISCLKIKRFMQKFKKFKILKTHLC